MRESQGENMNQGSGNDQNTPLLKLIDSFIRVSVIPLSIATIWLTLTNHQDNAVYGNLKFTSFTGLKYMICMSFISAIYAVLAIVSSWIRGLATKAWIFFLSDQVIAYLMVTSGAAVVEILYLAYNGDKEISWSEACKSYSTFCSRIKLAFIFHALALSCFILLAFISAFRAFTRFEPPTKELRE